METKAAPIWRKVRFNIPPPKGDVESLADECMEVVREGSKKKEGKTWRDAYGDAKEIQRLAAEAKMLEAKHELNTIKGGPQVRIPSNIY